LFGRFSRSYDNSENLLTFNNQGVEQFLFGQICFCHQLDPEYSFARFFISSDVTLASLRQPSN